MKLKRLFEDSYNQTPEQLPTDAELALEYPKISNYLDRRNQWRIDKHREEKEKERQHYVNKDIADKQLDIDIEVDRAKRLKERGEGEINIDAEDTAKRMLSRNIEDKKSNTISRISDMLTISLNNKDESFYNELSELIAKYPDLKRAEPKAGTRVIDADSPYKKDGAFIERFNNHYTK
jgi:hypothetical protein